MKRPLLILALCLTSATAFSDDFIVSKDVAQDHNGNKVRLNATKNTDGTYSLAILSGPSTVTADNGNTQTAATGTNWTALASNVAKQVTIVNTTGTSIDVRYGTGTGFTLPDGSGYTFRGLTNSSGLQIKRSDSSNTQVTVKWNYENF